MQKSKEILNQISSTGKKQSPKSGSNESAGFNKTRTKSFHPPIETYWQLQPSSNDQKQKTSLGRFTEMLSDRFKVKESFKRIGIGWSSSTKMVLEGRPHDPNDEKLVNSFSELLSHEGYLPKKQQEYHTILRFLRMRDFDLLKSKEMFLQYLRWRKDYGVDDISKEFKFEECEQVKKCYPFGFHGVDRCGRPVYIERIGMVDLDTLLEVTTMDRFIRNHVSEQEKTLNWRFPACSIAAKKHIASTLSILDVKNVGISHFSKPAGQLFLEIKKIDSNYYPETMHQIYMVNAGSRFKILWKTFAAFLDSRTLAKIRVLGTDYKKSLIEVIDPSELPSFLGGSCTCLESGGCLFSDKGPWNDPEISEMLRGMLSYGDQEHDSSERDASFHDDGKGLYELVSPSLNDQDVRHDMWEKEVMEDPSLTKVHAFEAVLEDAKEKIMVLEAALEDTKLALQGLGQYMQEMKL